MTDNPGERLVQPIPKGQLKPWVCRRDEPDCTRTKPCVSCRNRRNRRKGKLAQSKGRQVLEKITGVSAARWSGKLANEESWDGLPIRVECKAGAFGGANAVWNHYLRAENQSLAAKAIGDLRPFMALMKPDKTSEQLVVVRLSKLAEVIEALNG